MNLLKNLAAPKKREASGPLTGKILPISNRTLKVEAVLGEGGFATIYRAVDAVTQETFALKHFMLSGDIEAERDVHTEVAVMRALADCPHALSLHAAALRTDSAFLLLDYCQGTLASFLIECTGNNNSGHSTTSRLSNAEVTAAFLPIARAVSALHAMDPPMAHRDVKAENVLRRTDGTWVLCDFGSATSEQKVYSSPAEISQEEEIIRKQTTPAYRAPELWDLYTREFIGTAVDVWSLGCLLYFIAFGKLPFDGDAKLQILNGQYAVPAGRPEGVASLIADMLVVDPKGRLTAAEVASRAACMMEVSTGEGESTSFIRGSGCGTAAVLHRPSITATIVPQGIEPGSSNDAFTSNDAWGHAFDDVAPSTTTTTTTTTTMAAAVELPPRGGQDGGASGDWADFSAQKPPLSVQTKSKTTTLVAAQAPQPQPPSQQLENLQLDCGDTRSCQIREHCKVLEQLLDGRNEEISTLRSELNKANAATTKIEATLQHQQEKHTAAVAILNKRIEELHCRALQAEEELESLLQNSFQQAKNNKITTSNSLNKNSTSSSVVGSGAAAGTKSMHLSSFPLGTTDIDESSAINSTTMTTQKVSSELGGAPMRRPSSAGSAASPVKRLSSGLSIAGQQDSFFKDLNPLS